MRLEPDPRGRVRSAPPISAPPVVRTPDTHVDEPRTTSSRQEWIAGKSGRLKRGDHRAGRSARPARHDRGGSARERDTVHSTRAAIGGCAASVSCTAAVFTRRKDGDPQVARARIPAIVIAPYFAYADALRTDGAPAPSTCCEVSASAWPLASSSATTVWHFDPVHWRSALVDCACSVDPDLPNP